MASPAQQQAAQPPQYAQQPVQMIQQPQYVPQTQVAHSRKTNMDCCNPIGKFLPLKFRPAQFGLGICMILNGFASIVIGIVGIFTAYYVYHGSHHITVYPNPAAWTGVDIWAGLFVSYDSSKLN